jgi:dihydrofolate synthase / folylpolyglutamate synthase
MKGYSETLDYLYGLEQFGIVLGLDSVSRILSLIGNPHQDLPSVHIAGTNGKGSVAAMVTAMAEEAGYRTGAYTSPHLVSFTERITVDGKPISEEEVVSLTQFIRERIEDQERDLKFTFFDFTTAMAFEHFRRNGVQLSVVETGLGGRLDSTNITTPLVSVITNVGLDHQEYLGNTIEEIAGEKAGIVKKGVPVVTGATGSALSVIEKMSEVTKVSVLGRDFTFAKEGERVMSYRDATMSLTEVHIALLGDHQFSNAAVALAAISLLKGRGFAFTEETIRAGLSSVTWPARLEFVPASGMRPSVLFDGAHNPDGAETLAAYLRAHPIPGSKILIFGVMKDKDYRTMLAILTPVVDRVVLTRPAIERAAVPADLAPLANDAIVTDAVGTAIDQAFRIAVPGDLVIIAGSFYTIGEAKKFLDERT